MGSRPSTLPSRAAAPDLPRTLTSVLPTLGHGIGIWLTAGRSLLETAKRSGDQRVLDSWHALGSPILPQGIPIQGTLELELKYSDSECQVQAVRWSDPLSEAAWVFQCWLLHLPAHRVAWVRSIRESRFQVMRRVVPHCWHMEVQEPPPGSVIHGLNASSWAEVEAATQVDPSLQWLPVGDDSSRWLSRILPAQNTITAHYDCASNGRVELAQVVA